MSIAERIRMNRDVKEMTRRAIKILECASEDVSELKDEFLSRYGESV